MWYLHLNLQTRRSLIVLSDFEFNNNIGILTKKYVYLKWNTEAVHLSSGVCKLKDKLVVTGKPQHNGTGDHTIKLHYISWNFKIDILLHASLCSMRW